MLAEAIRDKPADDALRAELKANLTTLRDDAKLLANAGVEMRAVEALAALEQSGEDAAAQIGAALAEVPWRRRSRRLRRHGAMASASTEVLDAELLAIFLEEAHEVLGTIAAHLPRPPCMPHDQEVLTVIRRAFHTLKGSSRMVGLASFGEVAWAIEQVMNKWLKLEQDANADLLQLIGDAHQVFTAWGGATGGPGQHRLRRLTVTAAAARLLNDEEPPPPGPVPAANPRPPRVRPPPLPEPPRVWRRPRPPHLWQPWRRWMTPPRTTNCCGCTWTRPTATWRCCTPNWAGCAPSRDTSRRPTRCVPPTPWRAAPAPSASWMCATWRAPWSTP